LPGVAEEVSVPKVLEGVVVEKAAFALTAPPVMEALLLFLGIFVLGEVTLRETFLTTAVLSGN
jgi:hypothetical protein